MLQREKNCTLVLLYFLLKYVMRYFNVRSIKLKIDSTYFQAGLFVDFSFLVFLISFIFLGVLVLVLFSSVWLDFSKVSVVSPANSSTLRTVTIRTSLSSAVFVVFFVVSFFSSLKKPSTFSLASFVTSLVPSFSIDFFDFGIFFGLLFLPLVFFPLIFITLLARLPSPVY